MLQLIKEKWHNWLEASPALNLITQVWKVSFNPQCTGRKDKGWVLESLSQYSSMQCECRPNRGNSFQSGEPQNQVQFESCVTQSFRDCEHNLKHLIHELNTRLHHSQRFSRWTERSSNLINQLYKVLNHNQSVSNYCAHQHKINLCLRFSSNSLFSSFSLNMFESVSDKLMVL